MSQDAKERMMKNLIPVLFAWFIWCDGSNGIETYKPVFIEDKQQAIDELKESWHPEVLEWKSVRLTRAGCDFYEVKKIDYFVEVKTKKETVTHTEEKTIELGREVIFK